MSERDTHSRMAKRYQKIPSAITREMEHELVVMIPSSGQVFSLRGAAVEIWESLGESKSVKELVDTLSQVYTVDSSVSLEDDVLRALDMLKENGALL